MLNLGRNIQINVTPSKNDMHAKCAVFYIDKTKKRKKRWNKIKIH